jgi:myosin heavy subunit
MLEEDGIGSDRLTLKPPDNRLLLATLTGKLSVFSILNDLTLPRQYTDSDMLEGIRHKLKDSAVVSFDPRFRSHFGIHHSHSLIRYRIDEFKVKNQDRVTEGIREMVGRVTGSQPSMKEKTVLLKFRSEMERLVEEIGSCEIRFVRCLKTNQQKSAHLVEHHYLLNQISYMGIFQTIEMRNSNFPFRETYHQFHSQYYRLFKTKTAPKAAVSQLLEAFDLGNAFLLGRQRVYYTAELHQKLEHKLIEVLELEMKKILVIQRFYRKYKERKSILGHLKLISQRIAAFRRIPLLFVRAQQHPFRTVAKWSRAKHERRTCSVNKLHQMLVKLRSNTLASAVLILSRFNRIKP